MGAAAGNLQETGNVVSGPVALNANLRLSMPTAFAIHHSHIQMAPIVFFILFLCKVAALKMQYIGVGSNFIIHPVVQLPLFVEEEVETQKGKYLGQN